MRRTQLLGWLMLCAAALVWTSAPCRAWAESEETAAAQAQFQRATDLYAEGQYSQALEAYRRAHELVPHPFALFNMARCHENLGDFERALETYREALEQTDEPDERADIERRIANILARPVRVFITSEPSGASVLVDANESPEPGLTPTSVELVPGPHRVILTAEGYQPAILRVEVRVDHEEPVNAHLEAAPAGGAGSESDCPGREPCPSCRRVDLESRRPHIALVFPQLFTFTGNGRALGETVSGIGLEMYLNIGHWLVGGGLNAFTVLKDPRGVDGVNDVSGDPWSADLIETALTLNVNVEAGYVWSWDVISLGLITGLSLFLDLRSEDLENMEGDFPEGVYDVNNDGEGTLAYDNGQVHGMIGATVDFYIRRWFSLGIKVSLAMGSNVPERRFRLHVLTSTLLNFHL